MSQHTPGPWKVGRSGVTVITAGSKPMKDGQSISDYSFSVRSEADARLIVKAPEMKAWIQSMAIYLGELANGNLPSCQFDYAQAEREAHALLQEIEGG